MTKVGAKNSKFRGAENDPENDPETLTKKICSRQKLSFISFPIKVKGP